MLLRRGVVDLRQSWRAAHALLAIPIVLIVAVTVIDILAPPDIHLGPLLVAAPAITASFAGPWLTGLIGALAVAAQVVIAVVRDPEVLFSTNHQAQIAALVLVSLCVVLFCVVRERRDRELNQVRYVSETAQRVVLRPLPKRIGPLRVGSLYVAADAEAKVGGDLYGVVRTDTGTRLIIGDVRGKGMTSLSDATLLLGAFRAAAHRKATLPELAVYLDGSVCWNLAEPDEMDQLGEVFVTAVIFDIPDDKERKIEAIDCGHPPPLLLRGGVVTPLVAHEPAPPLGLGELTRPRYQLDTFAFEVGDLLLLYTDGVIEARNAAGEFYPLMKRVTRWAGDRPEAFLSQLRRDLLDHVGGRLRDDAAMIAIERMSA